MYGCFGCATLFRQSKTLATTPFFPWKQQRTPQHPPSSGAPTNLCERLKVEKNFTKRILSKTFATTFGPVQAYIYIYICLFIYHI